MQNVRNNGQITMNMQNACRNNDNCLVIQRVFLTEFPGYFSEKRASLAFYVFNPFLHKKLRSFGLYYDFFVRAVYHRNKDIQDVIDQST